MTPTTDIAELRAELNALSSSIAYRLNGGIMSLTVAQADAMRPDERHHGTISLGHALRTISSSLEAISWDADRLQSLRRRILDAEDTTERRVAS